MGGTQNNLGTTLTTLGEREAGTGRLEEAVQAYREALKEYTRERIPFQWALTPAHLGNALATLGEQKKDITLICEALTNHTTSWES